MRRHVGKWLVFWAIVLFAFVTTFSVFLVNPVIVAYSKSKIEALTVTAVNRAIADTVEFDMYRQLTDIRYDTGGRIVGIATNTVKMNGISMAIAHATQEQMKQFTAAGLGVPIGTFSGFPLFTGRGPEIPLRVVPVGAVKCDFDSEFIGQGINQTKHRVKLRVRTMMNLIMPLASYNVPAEIEVLLTDSIIVGEVPTFFLSK